MARKKNTAAPQKASDASETSPFSGAFDDFTLDSILAEGDFAQRSQPDFAQSDFDPDATMSYEAVGSDYPEIPLVNEQARKEKTPKKSPQPRRSTSTQREEGKASGSASRTTKPSTAKDAASPQPRRSRRSTTPPPELQPAAPERSRSSRRSAAVLPEPRSATGADAAAFRQASMHDTSYRVRGGGFRHRRTPIITILLALVVIAALAAAFYFLTNFVRALVEEPPKTSAITLTTNQARTAIDAEMPVLTGLVSSTPDEAFAALTDLGWTVFLSERFTSDNPDGSASGKEIIHLPAGGTEDTLKGYYEGGFNAYDFDELQTSFNGAWMLDLTNGDRGGYAQLKYINLNSEGLTAEIQHLLQLQGLNGESSITDKTGTDSFGNTFATGYTVVDETTYYWKAIGITFSDYYQGRDTRTLPSTAIFLKLSVAHFDFYGAGTP